MNAHRIGLRYPILFFVLLTHVGCASPAPQPQTSASEPTPTYEPTSEPTPGVIAEPDPATPNAPTAAPSTASGVCELPEVQGPCEAYIPRYRFDASSGSCVQFVYGGCQGNGNNFDTREACEAACKR